MDMNPFIKLNPYINAEEGHYWKKYPVCTHLNLFHQNYPGQACFVWSPIYKSIKKGIQRTNFSICFHFSILVVTGQRSVKNESQMRACSSGLTQHVQTFPTRMWVPYWHVYHGVTKVNVRAPEEMGSLIYSSEGGTLATNWKIITCLVPWCHTVAGVSIAASHLFQIIVLAINDLTNMKIVYRGC